MYNIKYTMYNQWYYLTNLTNLLLLKPKGISKVINRLEKNCITNIKYVSSKYIIYYIYIV